MIGICAGLVLPSVTLYLSRTVRYVEEQGVSIPALLLAQIAPLPWSHIALTGAYLGNEIDQPLERYRPIRANRFNLLVLKYGFSDVLRKSGGLGNDWKYAVFWVKFAAR